VVDVTVDRVGTVLGSAITLLVAAMLPNPTRVLLALAAGLALVATTVCRRVYKGYVLALEKNLRTGAAPAPPEDSDRSNVTRTALGLDREALLDEIRTLRGKEAPVGAEPKAAPPAAIDDDAFLKSVTALRSGSKEAIRPMLASARGVDLSLVSLVIPLLVRRDVAPDALRALRRVAPKVTGQLVDTLLNHSSDPALRRRVARILKCTPTPRAIDGLLLGLADPDASVRVECGKVLATIKAANSDVVVRPEAVLEAVQRELDSSDATAKTAALDHVFALLSLVLESEPVLISLQALRGDSKELRGTALEYLENVLPRSVRDALWPRLGAAARGPGKSRQSQEVERELLESMSGMTTESLRRALLRPATRPGPEE
jgi:hypothetical protein